MIDNAGVRCEERPTCPLCGSAGPIVHRNLVDRLFGAPGTWSLRRCRARRCHVLWLDPFPIPADIGKFYGDYYTHVEGEANRFLTGGASPRRRALKSLLSKVLFWRAPLFRSDLFFLEGHAPGRLLDVGCGAGALLEAASSRGWQAEGVDFDVGAVAAANTRPGVSARTGSIEQAAFPAGSFDAVTFDNVIEHLPDPASAFREAHRVLRPGGRLVMMTPNADALGHAIYGLAWRGLETPRHLFLFTPHLLARMASEAGFSKVAAFSYAAGVSRPYGILEVSEQLSPRRTIARSKLGRRVVELGEKLLDVAGVRRGELAVLVAHR